MKTAFPLPDIVLKNMRAPSVRDVLRQMTEALEVSQGIDGQALAKLLVDAETTGGSAIGDGIAVVSARVPSSIIPRRMCVFAHLSRAVPFKGVEQHACDVVYVMVTPENEAQAHLRDLSAIIRTMRDRDFVERLRRTPNSERALGLFRARDMALQQAA